MCQKILTLSTFVYVVFSLFYTKSLFCSFIQERRMDEGVQEEGADDVADEAAAAAPRPGIVASAWSFITTFFTSLIPEGPPQVN